jgi:hypothetical protein
MDAVKEIEPLIDIGANAAATLDWSSILAGNGVSARRLPTRFPRNKVD